MTPQQHLERAEQVLDLLSGDGASWDSSESMALALEALAHSAIAIGDLLGAPHSGPAAGVPSATPG